MSSQIVSWIKKLQTWMANHLPLLILLVLTLIVTVLLFRVELGLLTLNDLNGITPDWHSPLKRSEDRLEKTLRLPDFSEHSNWYLAIFLGTSRWLNLSSGLIVEADGIPVFRIDNDRLASMKVEGWLKIPISPELLTAYAEKTSVNIALYSEGQSNTLINIYGVDALDPMSEGSRFNGHSNDLSLEPGQQRGDFLIQFVPATQLPPLPAILAFLLFPIIVYTSLKLRLNQQWAVFGAVGVLMLVTLAVRLWPERLILYLPIIVSGGYGLLLTGWVWLSQEKVVNQQWLVGLTLAMIVFGGVGQYWTELSGVVEQRLAPDAIRYRDFGEAIDLFSKTNGFFSASFGLRTPMWPLMVNLAFNLIGTSDLVLRLATLFFTSTVVIVTYWLATVLLKSSWAGLIAALLVSFDPLWVGESVRGLREPFYTTIWLLFCVVCFGLPDSSKFYGWKRAVWTGAIAAVMFLTRPNAPTIMAIILTMPVLPYTERFFKRQFVSLIPRWTFPMSFIAILIAISFYMPHLYGMYQRHGDISWDTKIYARWLANMEFQDQLGTPGFPSPEEFAADSSAGPTITYLKYLFGLHTLPELGYGSLIGYRQALVNVTDGLPWVIIYLIAFPLVIIDFRCLPLLAAILIQLAPIAYLYSRQLLEPHRHILDIEPLAIIAAVYVLIYLCKVLTYGESKDFIV